MLHLRQTEPELWIFVDTFGLHLAPALASRNMASSVIALCCVRLVLRRTDRLISRWLSSFIAREELNTMTTKLNSRQSPPELSGTGSKKFLVSFRESYIRIVRKESAELLQAQRLSQPRGL